MLRLGPKTQQCIDAVLSKLTGLYVVQVARSYIGLRGFDRFEDVPEEVRWNVRVGGEPVFDVAPLHDPTIKHVLHGRLPIPPGAAIGQQAGIADWIIDAQVFIDPVVISKGAVIQHLDLIHWREYGQWALVLVQCISPAPDGVNLDGICWAAWSCWTACFGLG